MYIHRKGKICAPIIPAQSYHSLNLLNEESYPLSSQETCVRVTYTKKTLSYLLFTLARS